MICCPTPSFYYPFLRLIVNRNCVTCAWISLIYETVLYFSFDNYDNVCVHLSVCSRPSKWATVSPFSSLKDDGEQKRKSKMENLVREEFERWGSDASLRGGRTSATSPRAGSAVRSRPTTSQSRLGVSSSSLLTGLVGRHLSGEYFIESWQLADLKSQICTSEREEISLLQSADAWVLFKFKNVQ